MDLPDVPADGDIVGSIDRTGARPRFIVADITRDDAWLSLPEDRACSLEGWR